MKAGISHTFIYKFTIFTATYNRCHTLKRLFDSLCRQGFTDFEWLVVDDGSSDETSVLIDEFREEANFPIQYVTQTHQGKMRAHNLGLSYANGLLFLSVDSDDYLYDDALQALFDSWQGLSGEAEFAGISCLSSDAKREVIGQDFGQSVVDSNYDIMFLKGLLNGDRLCLWRTDLLKAFPYEVDSREIFVPDGLIFHSISRLLPVRFINIALQVVVYESDGISMNSISYRAENPIGMCGYYQNMMDHLPRGWVRFRCEINYFRYIYHKQSAYSESNISVTSYIARPHAAVLGWLLYVRDGLLIKCRSIMEQRKKTV